MELVFLVDIDITKAQPIFLWLFLLFWHRLRWENSPQILDHEAKSVDTAPSLFLMELLLPPKLERILFSQVIISRGKGEDARRAKLKAGRGQHSHK